MVSTRLASPKVAVPGPLVIDHCVVSGLKPSSVTVPSSVAKGDGTQDDLVRKGNGWQIEPENYEALVNTMKNALSDTARLREMGKESYRIVSEEINIETMADAFIKALSA